MLPLGRLPISSRIRVLKALASQLCHTKPDVNFLRSVLKNKGKLDDKSLRMALSAYFTQKKYDICYITAIRKENDALLKKHAETRGDARKCDLCLTFGAQVLCEVCNHVRFCVSCADYQICAACEEQSESGFVSSE